MQSHKKPQPVTRRLAWASLLWLAAGILIGVILDRQIQGDIFGWGSGPNYQLIGQAWHLIDDYYVDRSAVRSKPLTYAAISGMVDGLGDTGHSTFLTPAMVKEQREELSGKFPGIGADVRMLGKEVVVVAPLDNSPAQHAGLQPGDVIFKVDNRLTVGVSLRQVVHWIRGPAGTSVTLGIRKAGNDITRTVTIKRAVIHLQLVSWHMLPGTRIADVRIASFSKGIDKSLNHALAGLRAKGAQAIILDLRNNPGGLLYEAVDVASRFLSTGNVLLEKNVHGQIRPFAVEHTLPAISLPMVVLINAGTASSAEIVAGALRDDNRAKLVGESTFGTGTVLRQFPLSDGSAMSLAVEEWLTPKGKTIWHKGIKPDVVLGLNADVQPVYPATLKHITAAELKASKDNQLLKAMALLGA